MGVNNLLILYNDRSRVISIIKLIKTLYQDVKFTIIYFIRNMLAKKRNILSSGTFQNQFERKLVEKFGTDQEDEAS